MLFLCVVKIKKKKKKYRNLQLNEFIHETIDTEFSAAGED